MENHLKAKAEFDQRLMILENQTLPALVSHNLKDIVVYEKLMEIQEQVIKLERKLEKYNQVSL